MYSRILHYPLNNVSVLNIWCARFRNLIVQVLVEKKTAEIVEQIMENETEAGDKGFKRTSEFKENG